jgi:hypothetical protein
MLNSTKQWKEAEQQAHLLLVGIQNDSAILEDSLVVFHKAKFTQSSNHAPRYLSKLVEVISAQKPASKCL